MKNVYNVDNWYSGRHFNIYYKSTTKRWLQVWPGFYNLANLWKFKTTLRM